MQKFHLPLYRFFTRLRQELGIDLDMQQYLLLLHVWQEGQIPVKQWRDLLALCQTLWMSRAAYLEKFNELFYEEVALDCQDFFSANVPAKAERVNPEPYSKVEKNALNSSKGQNEDKSSNEAKSKEKEETHQKEDQEGLEASVFVRFSTNETQAEGGMGYSDQANLSDSKYIFSEKYFPINTRKVQQNWKYLQAKTEKIPGEQLDLVGCIEQFAQQGVLNELQYASKSISSQRVLVLIDSSHSMVAFERLAEHIVYTLQESLSSGVVEILYFNNVPSSKQLYHPDGYKVKAPWKSKANPDLTLIISDAGAAKGNQHKERIEATSKALAEMRESGTELLWLNPMPSTRWFGSAALALVLQVGIRMLEINDTALKQLPTILKHV